LHTPLKATLADTQTNAFKNHHTQNEKELNELMPSLEKPLPLIDYSGQTEPPFRLKLSHPF